MDYDELIENNGWSGDLLAHAKRMAEYLVDGRRFGGVALRTRSGTPNDVMLDKRTLELTTLCLTLSVLGFEGLVITTQDGSGRPLERPDFDVTFADGRTFGVEVADVSKTSSRKHEANAALVERAVRDRLDTDAAFLAAFGKGVLHVALTGGLETAEGIGSKREANAIAAEIIAFVHTRVTRNEKLSGRFDSRDAPNLGRRGARFDYEPWEHGAHFSIGDGGGTLALVPQEAEVLRVLDDHRLSAANGYRSIPTWIILRITDPLEIFHDTLSTIAALQPDTDPFERCYVTDVTLRAVRLVGKNSP